MQLLQNARWSPAFRRSLRLKAGLQRGCSPGLHPRPEMPPIQMGVYCNGVWFVDTAGTGQYDGSYSYWGWDSPSSPLVPVVGNWDGGGTKSQFGVYNQGVWFRDADGTHQWDAANQAAVAYLGWAGAQPVVGDWYNYTSAAGVLPQMGTAVSRFGAAIQASFTAATFR